MTWVYLLPTWLFYTMVVVGMAALASSGLIVYRRLVPQSDDLDHNDVAGPIIGTIGTILAVILSFLLVSVWREYDAAASTVADEASSIDDLYHLADEMPAMRVQLQTAIRTYVAAVVHDEWPAMKTGQQSGVARRASDEILRLVAGSNMSANNLNNIQQEALALVKEFQDARRDRLFDNEQGIPMVFWAGNITMAFISIGFCFIFRVRKPVIHVLMTAALAAVIGVCFVLIADFDYPFRGDTQIPPTVFLDLQDTTLAATGGG